MNDYAPLFKRGGQKSNKKCLSHHRKTLNLTVFYKLSLIKDSAVKKKNLLTDRQTDDKTLKFVFLIKCVKKYD